MSGEIEPIKQGSLKRKVHKMEGYGEKRKKEQTGRNIRGGV